MLVKMVNDSGKTADVHPDMVDEYKKGGFRVVEEPKKEVTRRGRTKQN